MNYNLAYISIAKERLRLIIEVIEKGEVLGWIVSLRSEP